AVAAEASHPPNLVSDPSSETMGGPGQPTGFSMFLVMAVLMTAARPAIEGWFVTGDEPRLLGQRCDECGTYVFPPRAWTCPNPVCRSAVLSEALLSRTGTVWSYTTNHYEAPPPYVAPDPFEPYTIVAVELQEEGMVVLGQLEGEPAQ